jgi:hypothetical protein
MRSETAKKKQRGDTGRRGRKGYAKDAKENQK